MESHVILPQALFNTLKHSASPLILDFRPSCLYHSSHIQNSIHLDVNVFPITEIFERECASDDAESEDRENSVSIVSPNEPHDGFSLDLVHAMIHSSSDARRFSERFGCDVILVVHKTSKKNDREDRTEFAIRKVVQLLNGESSINSVRFLMDYPRFAKEYRFLCVQECPSPSSLSFQRPRVYPSEILSGFLYLGSFPEVSCFDALNDLGIGYILNVASQCHDRHHGIFAYCKCDILDRKDVDISEHFEPAFKFIEEAKESNSAVVVHCQVGISRSATIVIAYLMKTLEYTLAQAFDHVRDCRPIIKPNSGFMRVLKRYDEMLQSRRCVEHNL